ncbi:MAG: glycine cleavage system protein R [Planctomycetota bacterium]
MDKHYIVMTAIGTDRPGLVDAVSGYVYQRGGNVESTRAATLGGEFAMILLVGGDEATTEAIRLQTRELERDAGLAVVVKPTAAPAEHPAPPDALPYELAVYAMDHPGIVQAVTHELARHDVNIRALDTYVESAPHTGTSFFHLLATIDVPAAENIAAFRTALAELAERLNVDIQLTAGEVA